MTVSLQIALGSLLLLACSIVYVLILIAGIRLLRSMATYCAALGSNIRMAVFLGAAVGVIVVGNTVQIWIWALSFIALNAIPSLADAVYFSLVTYTTLGYGDITLQEGSRIYAAMAAVTGLLNFGLSTAFLFGVFSKVLPTDLME